MILRSFILLLLCGTSSFLWGADAGKIRIPADATWGGRPVEEGLYTVELDETADRPYLRLIRNEKIVATDVAVALPARGSGKTSVSITKVGQKEFVRIRARSGSMWYFAYLETTRSTQPKAR